VEVLLQRRRELWAAIDALSHDGSIDDLERMLDDKARLMGLVIDNDKQYQIAEVLVTVHTWTIDAYNKAVRDEKARLESAAEAARTREQTDRTIARIIEREERDKRRADRKNKPKAEPAVESLPAYEYRSDTARPYRFIKTKRPTVWPDPEYPVPIIEAEAVEVSIPQLSIEVNGRAHGLLQWAPWARRERYQGRNCRRYEGFSKAWTSSGYGL